MHLSLIALLLVYEHAILMSQTWQTVDCGRPSIKKKDNSAKAEENNAGSKSVQSKTARALRNTSVTYKPGIRDDSKSGPDKTDSTSTTNPSVYTVPVVCAFIAITAIVAQSIWTRYRRSERKVQKARDLEMKARVHAELQLIKEGETQGEKPAESEVSDESYESDASEETSPPHTPRVRQSPPPLTWKDKRPRMFAKQQTGRQSDVNEAPSLQRQSTASSTQRQSHSQVRKTVQRITVKTPFKTGMSKAGRMREIAPPIPQQPLDPEEPSTSAQTGAGSTSKTPGKTVTKKAKKKIVIPKKRGYR